MNTKDGIVKEILHTAFQILDKNEGYQKLDTLIFRCYKDDYISNTVINDPKIKSNFLKLNLLMQTYERKYEDDFAKEFMNFRDKKADEYIEKYKGMVKSEGEMADLQKNDKVIILGGGSLPLTALTYTKVFDAHCTCIDIDQQAVETSKKLIEHMRLQDNIDIKYGNAFEYPLENYDLILVVCLLPKKKALEHVFSENKSAKVIYRSAIGLYKLWYGQTQDQDIEEYKILKKVNTDKKYAAESVLVTI